MVDATKPNEHYIDDPEPPYSDPLEKIAEPAFVRSAENYDRDYVSQKSGLDFSKEESLTQQQFAEEADINTIVKRFGLTGEIPGDFQAPMSGDFEDVVDFHTAMNTVRTAQEEFMRLPAQLRFRFNNDPQRMMDFLEVPGNYEEGVKLGLLKEREVTRVGDGLPIVTPK